MSGKPSTLRVGIDARCLNTAHPRGMGKYVSEVLSHTGGADGVEFVFLADRPDTVFHAPPNVAGAVRIFDIPGYRFHSWEQAALPWKARLEKMDVLHCTATTLPLWQPVPTVVTVHDTLPWMGTIGDPFERWYRNRLIPSAYRKCAAIVTISESSRRDILGRWPQLEPKLQVIPHGIADIYLETKSFSISAGLEEAIGRVPYLLYVGGALERKRFSWALRVFEHLEVADLRLVACGFDDLERERMQSVIRPESRGRVRFVGFVSEQDMPALYQNAVAVLYPTLYEGFGLPALEAQAVGTPVLMSAVGSLAELQGPAAEVLPADDLEAWLQTCRRLLAQRVARGYQDLAARKWARGFSWQTSAKRHLEVYSSAARRV